MSNSRPIIIQPIKLEGQEGFSVTSLHHESILKDILESLEKIKNFHDNVHIFMTFPLSVLSNVLPVMGKNVDQVEKDHSEILLNLVVLQFLKDEVFNNVKEIEESKNRKNASLFISQAGLFAWADKKYADNKNAESTNFKSILDANISECKLKI